MTSCRSPSLHAEFARRGDIHQAGDHAVRAPHRFAHFAEDHLARPPATSGPRGNPRPISMIASGLRTSCATPAASRPTDCSFSASISCACAAFSSSCACDQIAVGFHRRLVGGEQQIEDLPAARVDRRNARPANSTAMPSASAAGVRKRAARQHRADARHEKLLLVRLHHEIIRAAFQPVDDVLRRGERSEQHHRDIAHCRRSP